MYFVESDLVHRPMGKMTEIDRSAAAMFLRDKTDRLKAVIGYLQLAVISYNEYDQVTGLKAHSHQLESQPTGFPLSPHCDRTVF